MRGIGGRNVLNHSHIAKWKPQTNPHVRLSTLRFVCGHLTIALQFIPFLYGVNGVNYPTHCSAGRCPAYDFGD